MQPRRKAPSFVQGRRGGASLVDVLVAALWPKRAMTLAQLQASASEALGYDVPSSSIRSSVYSKETIFERVDGDEKRPGEPVRYRLTTWAKRQ